MTAPAGWYEDPGRARSRRRYWDGAEWTDWVADDRGTMTQAPLPGAPDGSVGTAFRTGWPLRVLWWFVLAFLGASLIAGIAYGAIVGPGGEESDLLLTVLGFVASFGSAAILAWLVSRRFGTGSIRSDLGISFTGRELIAGLGTAVLALVAAGVVGAVTAEVLGVDPAEGVDQFGDVDEELTGALVIAVAATFLAPVFEEALYRGILLPTLRLRLGSVAAVLLSAVIFSLLHLDPTRGAATNGVVVSVTLVYGLVFGWQAVRAGGIGRTVVAHALVNAYVSAFTISGAS